MDFLTGLKNNLLSGTISEQINSLKEKIINKLNFTRNESKGGKLKKTRKKRKYKKSKKYNKKKSVRRR